MSEKLKELPVPFYLPAGKKNESRALYRQVFSEDTEKFVDYYYSFKTRDNEILAIEEDEKIVSMLHLNPYQMIVNGYEVKSNYIVAVATQKEYRHRGYMRMLLEKALRDMSVRGMPFTFLMPASESIYAPFDFVWLCPHTPLPKWVERMEEEEQNRYLAARYQLFCKRDSRYLENHKAERRAEEGEPLPEKIPPFMARITDLCRMLHLVGSRQDGTCFLHVKDSVIDKNNGYFRWETFQGKVSAEKLKDRPWRLDLELTIGELASLIFGSLKCGLSEMV